MSCIFDVNKLQSSLKNLKGDVFKRLLLIKKSLTPEDKKIEILKNINELGESYLINPNSVEEALEAFKTKFFEGLGEAKPSLEEIRSALLSWQNTPTKEPENTSTARLDSVEKNVEKVKDDPLGFAYGRALKAKIRATLQANSVGVHSVLYNSDGIINTTEDLNSAIVRLLEELLLNIIEYLQSKGIRIEGKMYENGSYTGILEDIRSRYDINFRFDFNELNDLYNNKDFKTLDAFSSWVILNNFDTILKQTFGKAIEIDSDKSKFYIGKYTVAGGSNVYTTWRTNEEIDLSKEINNISLAIITTIPYYLADTTSPTSDRNLKFNEFVYLITKIKDIPHNLNEDYVIDPVYLELLSPEASEFLSGKSIISIINTLRDNPLKIVPYVIEAFNNKDIFDEIKARLNKDYFSSIDRDLINSIYQGLFNSNNDESLLSIQRSSGFKNNNYLAFITLTIDSIYKSNFLQYFRNPEGEIYVRPLYDLSLYVIELSLKTDINERNIDLETSEYDIEDDGKLDFNVIPVGSNYYTVDGTQYLVSVKGQGQVEYVNTATKLQVTDINIIEKLNLKLQSIYINPSVVSFTYKDYHEGPLKVEVNLKNGKINYIVNGASIEFNSRRDFDSLLPLIEKILRLNFDIDSDYLNAFLNRLVTQKGISPYGEATKALMQLVSRILVNKHILNNYVIGTISSAIKMKLDDIFGSEKSTHKPTYNSKTHHLNMLTDAEVPIINNLAQAKALVTGRLTSSQILDGDGNALAASALSRLANSLPYQVETQIKLILNSAAREFSLWKPGVYKGIYQLKEMKDNSKNTSKAHTQFSNKEMENALVFIDFLLGLTVKSSTRSPYAGGVVGFYPSENSDKTYVGRILIDLKKLSAGETSLYELIRTNPGNIRQYWPTIRQELGSFYMQALANINSEWNKIGNILGINISYGDWGELEVLAQAQGYERTTDYLHEVVTQYNYENPFNPITLTENVHYVNLGGKLIKNDSFVANLIRLESDDNFNSFMYDREFDLLESLLKDGLEVEATKEIKDLLEEEWIDPMTNKVILGKYYDPSTGDYIGDIRRYRDFDSRNKFIEINPLLSAYNSLNYFVTQEYMNSSVGAYYAHPNKKNLDTVALLDLGLITNEQAIQAFLNDEKVRKLALDKRNVSFTAAMHAMLKNLILGIPEIINIAVMPDVYDSFITVSGDPFINDIKPYDGATFTNPFYQILQNYSLGGAKVGLIKKTFTHYYDEKTGTGGIIKTAEFPLTNEYIRRSKFYSVMMKNMTDRVWRDRNGQPTVVDITTDYTGQPIVFSNPESDQGYMYYQDSETGKYYMFNITKGENPNTYIRTVQEVDENGLPSREEDSQVWTVNTNYDLWKMFGGEYSMSFTRGKFYLSEHSINQVVNIMNNTTTAGTVINNAETLEDVWQPLKHSDIHLMPTSGAVKLGAANTNKATAYTTADSSKINHFRIRTNQVGVQLDKEHHADGEDLSIMTLVLSACASRGYTQEQTQNLYNAMARLAEAGIRPYLKSFEEFFRVSKLAELSEIREKLNNASPNEKITATPQQLEQARQKFENVLLNTLIKALATSTNTAATILIVTQELLEKAKEGKEIDFANAKIPLSDPAVMRKLHSTISVALTKAAIKIKVDGSLNILCPSYGIVKVYDGKMKENFLNDGEIDRELEKWNENPLANLIKRPSDIKIGRTYKVTNKNGHESLFHVRTTKDYWKLRDSLNNYISIIEQFGSFIEYDENPMINPSNVQSQLTGTIDLQIEQAKKLGVRVDENYEPANIEEYVAYYFPVLNSKSFLEETGIKGFQNEGKLRFFNNTTGVSIVRAAENIYHSAIDAGIFVQDDLEVRDIIIDFVQNYTPSQVKNFIKESRLRSGLEEYESLYNQVEDLIKSNPKEIFEGGRELGSYNVTFSGAIQPNDLAKIYITGNPATTAQKAREIGGIDVLRHPDANGMHFGNPFTHLEKEVKENRAKVLMPNVRTAVQAFEEWLDGTNYLDVEPERRLWILDQINSGVLSGKTLVYHTNTIKDSEGTHYYNPKTFPNHALVLQRRINEKDAELAGPLFQHNLQTEYFNLYDLVSIRNLYELKESKNYTKLLLDEALAEVLKDLNTLHSRQGQVLTYKGLVEINPKSVLIEPYEIVMPKIFATVFGLEVDDDLDTIKKDPNFFTKRLLQNLKPTHNEYTICLQRINGKHTYILNSNDAIQSEFFRPKQILTIREDGKLYRYKDDEKLYEIGENDLVWEKIDSSGNVTEVIITDNPLSYLDRIDYTTININRLNNPEYNLRLVEELRNSNNKTVQNYLKAFDLMMTREGETFDNALEDILEVSWKYIEDSPVGKWYKKLGAQIHSSFLKSLEIVAARIPAQSMLSFMPMKVVGFEKSDRNTAYVSTTLFLFLGSDLDIDAVSLASFAFDKSGRYILHSPYANIDSFELLKASEQLPFPTGVELEINDDEYYDYSQILALSPKKEQDAALKPFHRVGNKVIVNTSTVEAIEKLKNFIEYCNKNNYIPASSDASLAIVINYIRGHVNIHNNYINNSKNVEEFSKNFMVASMFNIGLSPANLIESLQAMDSITGPLKDAAAVTLKALNEQSNDNPAAFTTNIHGFVLNMDGKTGVGICAVGLKSFFAATARYNEVLANGTPEEVERLKSDVTIANRRFLILANTYTTNEVNRAILGNIIDLIDLGKDAALILSGLLSLATDNAKELALSKLNAANMLGMYIYGIAIGMDFKDISKIIASKTGQVVDSLIKEDVINNQDGMNMENIFDYLELGPKISHAEEITLSINLLYSGILSNKWLRDLAWGRAYIVDGELIQLKDTDYDTLDIVEVEIAKLGKLIITKNNLFQTLEQLKKNPGPDSNKYYKGTIEFNRNIENAQKYLLLIIDITEDTVIFGDSRAMLYYNGTSVNMGVYGDLKKLYRGGEEMKTLGLLLHINQGNETSYIDSLGYIDKIESAISTAKYRRYREKSRENILNELDKPKDNSGRYEINFHKFITNPMYKEGCIDLYEGVCRKDLFMKSSSYREIFLQARQPKAKDLEKLYEEIAEGDHRITPIKTFFNVLDILNVPHYARYLQSADMLHQLMLNSIKYRSIYKLGKTAIKEIGAYSAKDRENVFRRTEQFVDRLLRDRYFISLGIEFEIPAGQDMFVRTNTGKIELLPVGNSPATIRLGTREGNASFKKLMEDVIIPQLKRLDKFKGNKFIQSLDFTLFNANPEQQVTRCYAPNINMSPRSDVDNALFEEVKHDFNILRTSDYTYLSKGVRWNLIDLFYYYNLIAFGGRVGQNTMTNIFQDVLDYRAIKNYRDYEAQLDKYGEFELIREGIGGSITLDTLLRETAPRANEFSTKLNYFYQEDWKTGELSFIKKVSSTNRTANLDGVEVTIDKFNRDPVAFTMDEDAKNYLVLSTDSDIVLAHFTLDNGQMATILIEKGSITDIAVDGVSIKIPIKDKIFFRNLKMISRITPDGILEKYYNKKEIVSKVNEIVSCKL